MSQSWRTSAVTAVGLFLETCAFYLVAAIVSAALDQPRAGLSFWLVLLALSWAFLLSGYVQSLTLSRNLRGTIGLVASVVSLLVLSHLNTGLGLFPFGEIIAGDKETAIAQMLTLGFLGLVWWRGVTMAHDEVTLDTVRGSFRWGLMALFAAALVEGVSSAEVVNGYLVVGFFAVGLAGLSLARFSSEVGDSQVMSLDWWLPIGASVAGVILLGLLVSVAGLGGLDDVTRAALRIAGTAGLWVLKPVLLALGYLAALLVALGNWVSGWFDRGDLTALEQAQEQLRQFHEGLEKEAGEGGAPHLLVALLRWGAFLAGMVLGGWVLHRIFRFRRLLRRSGEVEVTRESLFTWSRANRDLASLLGNWWNTLGKQDAKKEVSLSDSKSPQEFYHGLLALAARLGRPRRDWQTPKEHQPGLRGLLPGGPVGRIVDRFQSAHYGGIDWSDQDIDRLRQDWAAITEFLAEQQREG
jgi:hypothetical protein